MGDEMAETDAKQVLEKVRVENYADDDVSSDLLAAVYALEHGKQFEDERGPVRAQLRELIASAVQESS
jgi:hypothetical protein